MFLQVKIPISFRSGCCCQTRKLEPKRLYHEKLEKESRSSELLKKNEKTFTLIGNFWEQLSEIDILKGVVFECLINVDFFYLLSND